MLEIITKDTNLTGTYNFSSNTLNQIDYSDAYSNADVAQMLNDGAVFLPCVGYRYDGRYYDYRLLRVKLLAPVLVTIGRPLILTVLLTMRRP